MNLISQMQPYTAHNHKLYYAGHGKLESSFSFNSIAHVMSHELGHVNELRNEAFILDGNLKYLNIDIDYAFQDGKVVAVSGKTTGIIESSKNPDKEPVDTWQKSSIQDSMLSASSKNYFTEPPTANSTIQNTLVELKKVEKRLDALKQENKIQPPYVTTEKQNLNQRIVALEGRKEQLEKNIESDNLLIDSFDR